MNWSSVIDLVKNALNFVGSVLDFCKTFVFEFPIFIADVVGLGNLPNFVKSWIGMLVSLIVALAIIKLVKDVRGATV